jgi:hypothetical protein
LEADHVPQFRTFAKTHETTLCGKFYTS